MSKKLIAVASAAALALSALVGIAPASAAAFGVTPSQGTDVSTAGTSATTAFTIKVPETNEIVSTTSTTTSRAIKFVVATTTATGTVNATVTGGLRILTQAQLDDADTTTATGTTTLSVAAISESATFYVYSTSTTAGTLTVTNDGNSYVKYIKGVAGTAYSISAKFPTAVTSGANSSIDVTVTDVFGNPIVETTAVAFSGGTLTTAVVGAASVVTSATAYTWNVTRKVWEGKVVGSTTPGSTALTVTLSGGLEDQEANGLPSPVLSAFSALTTADLSAQVTALTAQVAALKADYNALAAKWNKRVASKKAPKKAVATK
jgi:hypothetical protein